mmetsp:Transcript_1266/g.2326  ORF Transcript_1266/g.2326 Transcript_1266/m.2326 type:complete len:426 (-) Transcript_1266:266-1543(-)
MSLRVLFKNMENLPIEILLAICRYLDVSACFKSRLVSRKWRRLAARGCISLTVSNRAFDRITFEESVIGSISLIGSLHECSSEEASKPRKRTRGHLPEPAVLVRNDALLSVLSRFTRFENRPQHDQVDGVPTKLRGFAARIECDNRSPFVALDLKTSKFHGGQRLCTNVITGEILDTIIGRPRPIVRVLEVLNISELCHLQRLSVRGCSFLRQLFLPPNLVAFDASGCTYLRRLYMPRGVGCHGLEALNLNGCRSLEVQEGNELFGPGTELALRNANEVDLSAVSTRAALAIARALGVTTCLETVSLRYVATDHMLMALSQSTSARESLRFIDVAFSSEVTDTALGALVQSASKLERFNLRGCKKVSVECYNKLPVLLKNRMSGTVDGQSSSDRKARKGDNIFFFIAAHGLLKERASKPNKIANS